MFILPLEQLPYYQNYAFREKFFSGQECDRVLELMKAFPLQEVLIRKDENLSGGTDLRKSRLAVVPWVKEVEWVYQRLSSAVVECNKAMYSFRLTGFLEAVQIGQYQTTHFFDWHQDFASREQSVRKLSIIVQLTDGADYEGGDLEFFSGRGPQKTVRSRGALLIFPSFVLSRISSIVQGTRNALEGWVSGPPFQ